MTEIIRKHTITLDKTDLFKRGSNISICSQEILKMLVEECADQCSTYAIQILIIENPEIKE